MNAFFKPALQALDDILNKTVIFGYDKVGYHVRKPLWREEDTHVDMTGKVCLITGANSGLGFATAKALASKGAHIIMGCRSKERGEKARQKLMEATGNTNIDLELIDLSKMDSVRDAAARIQERYAALHVLINNAGALFNERKETDAGFEQTFATDLLGPYLLTRLLLPLLKASAPARIIMVVSGGMYFGQLHLEDLQFKKREYNGSMAYAEAKRGLMVLTKLWARELAGTGVTINAMHPGWADTPGVADALPGFHKITGLVLRDNEQGADTSVWLATKPHLKASGQLFFDRKARETHRMPKTRSSLSEIETFWKHLGQLTEGEEPFPYRLRMDKKTAAPAAAAK